ncbi:MAG: hypothetical protein HS104_09705 [Polyangiaceae bacterium]|nr:hypothetical protein [Polyangiaceae bacterium]
MTAYGTSAIKRFRSTKDQISELDSAILDYVAVQNPITVRGIFYAMSVRGHVPKNDAGYRRVQRRVLDLRRASAMPYGWVSDSTRWQHAVDLHNGLDDLLDEMQRLYKRDFWRVMPEHVQVWCEKEALAGVLSEATYKWRVPLFVSRGFASETYLFESAESIRRLDKPVHIYLFTDYDAAGLDIDTKIREGLERFGEGAEIHFHRAALTPEQIREMDLPTRDPKPRDVERGIRRCVELDAIPPKTLIEMVENVISGHVDGEMLDHMLVVEAAERETLKNIKLPGWPS